jgi:HD-GYP domain-containing protein (c-di-GMP phosphodiesterase class II)
MKTHSEAGYRILKEIPGLSQIAFYVLCHHERWDGLGYPQGFYGENIPIPSRIVAIADTFDAITQNRVYHSAEELEVARDEIIRCSGNQFDPSLVQIFNDIYPDIECAFDNNRI